MDAKTAAFGELLETVDPLGARALGDGLGVLVRWRLAIRGISAPAELRDDAVGTAALDAGHGRIYNVGTERQITDDEIFLAVCKAVGASIEPIYTDFRKGEVRHIALDATRLRTDLGWTPRTTLEQGMPRALEYYRARRGG